MIQFELVSGNELRGSSAVRYIMWENSCGKSCYWSIPCNQLQLQKIILNRTHGKMKWEPQWLLHLENYHTCLQAAPNQASWSPYSHSQNVIKHFDVLWLDSTHSNLPCRYSLQYSCIHTGSTDWQCVWGVGYGCTLLTRKGAHVHLAIGGIKAKLYCSFKALRRCRWSLLIPCQSAVSVHSPLSWRINERHQTGIPIARAFMHNIKPGKALHPLFSKLLISLCNIQTVLCVWQRWHRNWGIIRRSQPSIIND